MNILITSAGRRVELVQEFIEKAKFLSESCQVFTTDLNPGLSAACQVSDLSVKSSEMLAKKMIWFIENSDQIETMGIESRKMVEDKFDVHKVNKEMLRIMEIA